MLLSEPEKLKFSDIDSQFIESLFQTDNKDYILKVEENIFSFFVQYAFVNNKLDLLDWFINIRQEFIQTSAFNYILEYACKTSNVDLCEWFFTIKPIISDDDEYNYEKAYEIATKVSPICLEILEWFENQPLDINKRMKIFNEKNQQLFDVTKIIIEEIKKSPSDIYKMDILCKNYQSLISKIMEEKITYLIECDLIKQQYELLKNDYDYLFEAYEKLLKKQQFN